MVSGAAPSQGGGGFEPSAGDDEFRGLSGSFEEQDELVAMTLVRRPIRATPWARLALAPTSIPCGYLAATPRNQDCENGGLPRSTHMNSLK